MAKIKMYTQCNPVEAIEKSLAEDNATSQDAARKTDPWLADLMEQKRHISRLQNKLESLREQVRECRKELQMAEARLFAIIEEAGQKHLPLE